MCEFFLEVSINSKDRDSEAPLVENGQHNRKTDI